MAMLHNLLMSSRTVLKSPFLKLTANCGVNRTIFLARRTCTTQPLCKQQELKVIFIKPNGERIEATAKVGDSLLDVILNNEIDLNGFGACEGTLTCSTCHLIIPKNVYDSVLEEPSTDEIDMLDLLSEVSETSRLGCQIRMTKELNGLEVHVPSTINDARLIQS